MLTWSFSVQDAWYRGTLSAGAREDLADLAAAAQVTVLYLPENPRRNTLFLD